MKEEYVVNRAQFLNDFRRRFSIKSDVISPDFFCDMLHHYKWLRDAWDKACEIDRQHNI